MEKLGYDWPGLHARFPSLIYVAISGFGHTGPYKEKPAYDMVVQGMGGVMSLTGHPGHPPTRVGTSIGDIAAGLFALSAIGAALYHRERTGEPQKIDVAMLDCQVALLENAIARYVATGTSPGPLGSRHPSITPFAAFQTADQPIIIAAGNNQLFARLCTAVGAPALASDPRFATNDLRNTNHAALGEELERALKSKPAGDWLAKIEAAGVPCGPINNVAQVLADPHVLSRNMVVTMEDAEAGTLTLAGNPMKLSAFADPATRPPAPALNESGDAIRHSGFAGLR
jgi:CoA:oxalate CoA-transferase